MPYLTLTLTENLKLQLSPGLVASYDIQPGNGVGLFWDKHTHVYLLTYLPRTHTGLYTDNSQQQPATATAIYNRNEALETCVAFICDHFCLCTTTETDHLCDHDHRSPGEDYQTSPDAELCWTAQMTDHHRHGTYRHHHPSPLLPDSSVHYTQTNITVHTATTWDISHTTPAYCSLIHQSTTLIDIKTLHSVIFIERQ